MNIDEFISGPCAWRHSAPEALRRQFLEDASSWQRYSTSRVLDGSGSRLLVTIGNSRGAPDATGIKVELLPGHLAARWHDPGLHFATEHDLEDGAFADTLIAALALARDSGPVHGTVMGLCRSLHPLAADDDETDISFSDPELPFSVFVSCPPSGARNRAARIAESLVHEALHLQLSLVEKVEPLVAEDACAATVYSPWKGEKRTLQGLVHAVYVFGNLRHFWKGIASMRRAESSFAEARAKSIDLEMKQAAHLASSGLLTASGRRLVASFIASPDRLSSATGRLSAGTARHG